MATDKTVLSTSIMGDKRNADHSSADAKHSPPHSANIVRKTYHYPILQCYGKLGTLTMGGRRGVEPVGTPGQS